MKKSDLGSALLAIAQLGLIYLFWFTPVKDKFKWWQKFIIWFAVSSTIYSLGYAIGKNEDETVIKVQTTAQ